MTPHDTAFQISAANVRFGPGVTREVGMDLHDLGLRRVLLLIDPALTALRPGRTVRESLEEAGIEFEVYDRIAVEPTDASFADAIAAAAGFEGFVALGGGSTIDTAKAANLY